MRKPGFYWVKWHNEMWEVLFWTGTYWIAPGLIISFEDSDLKEIDETPLERKPSYTVDIDALGEINIA